MPPWKTLQVKRVKRLKRAQAFIPLSWITTLIQDSVKMVVGL
jgi:hypothetical protein